METLFLTFKIALLICAMVVIVLLCIALAVLCFACIIYGIHIIQNIH